MARHEVAYEFAVEQGISNMPLLWCWATVREQGILEPVTTRTVARALGWHERIVRALLVQAQDLRLVRRVGPRWAIGEVDPVETLALYRDWCSRPPKVWTQEDLRRHGFTMREQEPGP